MPETNYIATSTELTETADAIREKTGGSSPIEWEEGTGFADAVSAIQTELPTQTKSVTPTESAQTVTPDAGYALSEVDVGAISSTYVGSGITRRSSTDLSVNGDTVSAPAGFYGEAASKSVAAGTQGTPTISVSSGGLITASATDTTGYITGTTKTATQQMTARTSSDLTASGATVTAPAGYYNAAASKSVASGTQGTPSISVSSAGLITASCTDTTGYITGTTKSATQQMTARTSTDLTASGATVTAPAGYYNAAASKSVASGSAKPPSSISGSSATVSTGTNTLTLSKTISVTPTVTAGYVSAGTAGNVSVSLTGSVTTKAAATITPGTSNQTIAAGTYLTGAQTIAGDANLVAGNIKSGVSIFSIAGSFAGGLTYVDYHQTSNQYNSNASQMVSKLFPSNGEYLVVIGGGHWSTSSNKTGGGCLLYGWITKSGNTYTNGAGKYFYGDGTSSVSTHTGNTNDITVSSTIFSFTSHIHGSATTDKMSYNIVTFKK